MNQAAYSLQEAQALCERYQYLVGKKMFPDKDWTIDCVAVAPADRLNQWLFAHFYLEAACPKAALNFYQHPGFDVIVLSVHDRKLEAVAFKDIRTYLEEQGLLQLDPIAMQQLRREEEGGRVIPLRPRFL